MSSQASPVKGLGPGLEAEGGCGAAESLCAPHGSHPDS